MREKVNRIIFGYRVNIKKERKRTLEPLTETQTESSQDDHCQLRAIRSTEYFNHFLSLRLLLFSLNCTFLGNFQSFSDQMLTIDVLNSSLKKTKKGTK